MQDKGEKIVTLAREILRSDVPPHLPEQTSARITLSFKMLCVATILTAIGSSAVTALAIEARRPLNHYERTELDALIFYAARQQNINENDVRQDVLDTIHASSFDMMTERDFLAARSYLHDKTK